jgi:hypothetical protein
MFNNKDYFIEKTINWCRALFCIPDNVIINYDLKHQPDCWGCSSQVKESHYAILIDPTMSIRDTVSTTIHEMIHVKQWEFPSHVSNKNDGEDEAEEFQYKLTDLLWGLGLL